MRRRGGDVAAEVREEDQETVQLRTHSPYSSGPCMDKTLKEQHIFSMYRDQEAGFDS